MSILLVAGSRMELWIMHEGKSFFGGSQQWFDQSHLQRKGCGLICASNLLCGIFAKERKKPVLRLEQAGYMKLTQQVRPFFPVIPFLGMSGMRLMLGMNAYFLIHGLPYYCLWGIRHKGMYERMEEMLEQDLPVILSVGRPLPRLLSGHKVSLYEKCGDSYQPSCKISAHFVTVYGMDPDRLRVSSWGKEYYIKREELTGHALFYSNPIYTNILVIRKR